MKVTKETAREYYDRFKELGVHVTKAVGDTRECCQNDPHGDFPIYKEIGSEIDALIEKQDIQN